MSMAASLVLCLLLPPRLLPPLQFRKSLHQFRKSLHQFRKSLRQFRKSLHQFRKSLHAKNLNLLTMSLLLVVVSAANAVRVRMLIRSSAVTAVRLLINR